MRALALVGIILLVAGIISLVYGGFVYRERETLVEVGPVEVTAEEQRKFPIPPVAGGAMVAAGLVLLVLGISRR